MRDTDTETHAVKPFVDVIAQQRAVGDDRQICFGELGLDGLGQGAHGLDVDQGLATPELDLLGRTRHPGVEAVDEGRSCKTGQG